MYVFGFLWLENIVDVFGWLNRRLEPSTVMLEKILETCLSQASLGQSMNLGPNTSKGPKITTQIQADPTKVSLKEPSDLEIDFCGEKYSHRRSLRKLALFEIDFCDGKQS